MQVAGAELFAFAGSKVIAVCPFQDAWSKQECDTWITVHERNNWGLRGPWQKQLQSLPFWAEQMFKIMSATSKP